MVAQDDSARPEQVSLTCHELGQRSLDGLSVDVATASRSQDSHVRAQVVQDTGPVTGGVLVQERTFRSLEQEYKAAAITAWTLVARAQVLQCLWPQAAQPFQEFLEACHPLLVSHSHVTEAYLVGVVHSPFGGPHAGMQARVNGDSHIRREPNAFTPIDCHELCKRHPFLLHDAHRLVGADDGGTSTLRDAFRSPEVVEVGVSNHDPVSPVDVVSSQTRAGSRGNAVDVGVKEDYQLIYHEPESGTAVPVKPRRHGSGLLSALISTVVTDDQWCYDQHVTGGP